MRSIEICDASPADEPGLFSDELACRAHCEKNYLNMNREIKNANKKIAQSVVKESKIGQPSKCCCRFDSPWPVLIKPEAIGRKSGEGFIYLKKFHCLPVHLTFKISKRTQDAYETMCSYLRRGTPMTMLELKDFSAAASYLNYVRPKNPNILLTLKIKPLTKMTLEIDQLLEEEIFKRFLNSHKSLEQFDGYTLETYDLRMLRDARSKLSSALKCEFVGRSYDEYVISFVAMDMMAAIGYIKKLAVNQFGISENLLKGDYNQYNPSTKPAYFTVSNLNCPLANETKSKLIKYIAEVKSTLSGLFEELIFEHMAEKYAPLIELHQAQQVLQNLVEVNCRSPANKSGSNFGRRN